MMDDIFKTGSDGMAERWEAGHNTPANLTKRLREHEITLMHEAADKIEAQAAEIERLRRIKGLDALNIAGMVVVPREPTEEMRRSGGGTWATSDSHSAARSTWQSMIKAWEKADG